MAEIDLSQSPARWAGWTVFAIIFIGGTALFVGISAFNAGQMALVLDEGSLHIEKGDFLPWGRSSWVPSPAFEPIAVAQDLDAEALELPLGPCDDELECERRFYEATLRLTEAALSQGSQGDVGRARELIVRAQLFPHITLAERAPIEDLTGGVHYVEALVLLEEVRRELELARTKLERSRIAGVPHVEQARREALLEMVERQLELFDAAAPAEPDSAPSTPGESDAAGEGPI